MDLAPVLLSSYLLGMATGLLPPDTLSTPFADAPMVPHSRILAVPRCVPAARLPLLDPLVSYLMQPDVQRQVFGRGLVPGTGAAQGEGRLWIAAMTPELAASLEGRATAPPLNPYAQAFMINAWDARIGARYGEEW